jgi:hypothetical protein
MRQNAALPKTNLEDLKSDASFFHCTHLHGCRYRSRQPGLPAPQKQPLYEHLIQNYGLQSHKLCIRQAKIALNHPGILLTIHAQHNSKHTPLQHHFVLSHGVI